MDLLLSLWLPILLSTAAVWVAASIAWMALPHHKKHFVALPDEQALITHLRAARLAPGNYMFPHFGSHKEASTPEAKAKWKDGPVGNLTIMGPMNMGRNMALSGLVYLAVSFGVAYLGAVALPRGADFWRVMQVLGTAGVLGYTFAFWPSGIWFGVRLRSMLMMAIDGIVFGLITGAIFAAMWPGA
jgi:hypothetical protein